MFWAADDVAAFPEPKEKREVVDVAFCFLQNYIASVVLPEDT